MNKRPLIPALTLCALLCAALSGCAAMLNREYSSSTPHMEYPVNDKAAVLQADNYQGLVNAVLYFVTEHEETGILHLSYARSSDQVAEDLDAACREVRTEDPLGAYAVADIQYGVARLTYYYEVTVTISYAHTVEELAAITPVAGSTAIRQTVSAAMAAHAEKSVFRVSYFTGDSASLRLLIRQTWLDTPLALVEPEIHVSLYPRSGTSRIVEVTLGWPADIGELAEQSAALEQRALELLQRADLPPEGLTPEALLSALRREAVYDAQGADTAYAVLVEGRGNHLGFVRTLRLLCQLTDLDTTVAEGTRDGEPGFWLIVNTAEGYRHLDPALPAPVYATDEEFSDAGYTWDTSRYPACTKYTAPAEPEPGASEGQEEPDPDETAEPARPEESDAPAQAPEDAD